MRSITPNVGPHNEYLLQIQSKTFFLAGAEGNKSDRTSSWTSLKAAPFLYS